MKIAKHGLIVIFCVLAAVFLYCLTHSNFSKKHLPEPYVGPEMHLAAMRGDIDTIRSILRKKPELLTQTDKYGNSPLHLAAHRGHTDVVRFLILQEGDVNVRNNFGGTPLYMASYAGHDKVAELLIAKGAEINAAITDNAKQVRQVAVLEGYRDYSDMYSAMGGIINVKVHYIGSPLEAAAANGHKKVAELLISKGASINAEVTGRTPLHSASVNGHAEMVKLLIANGAEVDARTKFGETPLFAAMHWSREPVDKNLILGVAQTLIQSGAEVNVKSKRAFTPLHYAAGWANKETVKLLLAAGADINAKSEEGDTPLNVACRYRPKKKGGVIDLLHKNGAVRKHGKNNSYEYEPNLIGAWP